MLYQKLSSSSHSHVVSNLCDFILSVELSGTENIIKKYFTECSRCFYNEMKQWPGAFKNYRKCCPFLNCALISKSSETMQFYIFIWAKFKLILTENLLHCFRSQNLSTLRRIHTLVKTHENQQRGVVDIKPGIVPVFSTPGSEKCE